MKKIYITPTLKVKRIKPHSILALSGEDPNANVNPSSPVEEGGMEAKQGGGFDWGTPEEDESGN